MRKPGIDLFSPSFSLSLYLSIYLTIISVVWRSWFINKLSGGEHAKARNWLDLFSFFLSHLTGEHPGAAGRLLRVPREGARAHKGRDLHLRIQALLPADGPHPSVSRRRQKLEPDGSRPLYHAEHRQEPCAVSGVGLRSIDVNAWHVLGGLYKRAPTLYLISSEESV